MAANTVAIAVRPERHKRLRRGEKIAHPSRMDSGIAPTDHSALMVAHQDSQLHRNRLGKNRFDVAPEFHPRDENRSIAKGLTSKTGELLSKTCQNLY